MPIPYPGFDPMTFRPGRAAPTHLVQGGDEIDLGDRRFTVVDLPGHTPGSIGLIDHEERALISGDAVYDGGLIDTLPESDIPTYLRTMDCCAGSTSTSSTPDTAGRSTAPGCARSPSATCANAAAEAAQERSPSSARAARRPRRCSATPAYWSRDSRSCSTR